MTDKEKLTAIKENVLARFKSNTECENNTAGGRFYAAKADEDRELLSFIDSIQEEPKLEGVEKEVAEGYVARINRKRIPVELKGEIKAKFKNEFHTIWQIVNGMQFANVAKYIIERICLHFATWGAYHLKDYIGMSDKEKAKMDSIQEEPVSEDLEQAAKEYADEQSVQAGIQSAFIAGGQWQKQQMMKNCLDYTIMKAQYCDEHLPPLKDLATLPLIRFSPAKLLERGLKVGDKVKIIIVKKD